MRGTACDEVIEGFFVFFTETTYLRDIIIYDIEEPIDEHYNAIVLVGR